MEAVTPPVIECGVASWTLPGQPQSGDAYSVCHCPTGVLVAVVDGLGHGEQAARAAQLAVATTARHAQESLITLAKHCHDRLRETRGVVMSFAFLNAREETLTWMGIGNVEGLLLRSSLTQGHQHELLLLRSGIVGVHLPPLQAAVLPVVQGDTLIFATDGISSAYAAGLSTTGPPQHVADRILRQHKKGSDDALVLVARYTG